jgi:hypothetical protein
MARVSPEQALAMVQAAKAEAAARSQGSETGTAQEHDSEVETRPVSKADLARLRRTREGETADAPAAIPDTSDTADVRRPAGPFLHPDRPVATSRSTPERPGPRTPPAAPPATVDRPGPRTPPATLGRRRRPPRWLSIAILRAGDIPIRTVYGIGAAIVTAIVVVLIFMLFSGDKPGDPVRVSPAQGGGPAPSVRPKPTPTPIAVPPVPETKLMTLFAGPGSPIAAYVADQTAGISYVQYGTPWAKTSRDPFSAAQKAGPSRQPQALIGSAPVPVAVGKAPATYADFRKLAGKAAKWTLRYQPAGSTFTWTVSQQARYNLGWVLGYKVSYVSGGKKHSSQAYVVVISTAKKKPAMLFASVPDTRKPLFHDLNMLFWTVRAI